MAGHRWSTVPARRLRQCLLPQQVLRCSMGPSVEANHNRSAVSVVSAAAPHRGQATRSSKDALLSGPVAVVNLEATTGEDARRSGGHAVLQGT